MYMLCYNRCEINVEISANSNIKIYTTGYIYSISTGLIISIYYTHINILWWCLPGIVVYNTKYLKNPTLEEV